MRLIILNPDSDGIDTAFAGNGSGFRFNTYTILSDCIRESPRLFKKACRINTSIIGFAIFSPTLNFLNPPILEYSYLKKKYRHLKIPGTDNAFPFP